MPNTINSRLVELDALRGIAAVMVMLFHYCWIYTFKVSEAEHSIPDFWRTGRHGVELFFIISGFVMPLSMEKAKTMRDFAYFRFSRLYPTFWVCVFFSIGATIAIPALANPPAEKTPSLYELVANLTMLPSFLYADFIDGVYWTLHYELVFYGIIGVSYYLCYKRHTLGAFLSLNAYLLFWHWIGHPLAQIAGISRNINYISLEHYGLFFASGYALYLLYEKRHLRVAGPALAIIIVTAIVYGGYENARLVLPISTAVVAAALFLKPAVLRTKALQTLGAISYPLYLIHQDAGYELLQVIELRTEWHLATNIGFTVVCIVAISFLIHRWVEIPAMKGLRSLYTSYCRRKRLHCVRIRTSNTPGFLRSVLLHLMRPEFR